MKVISDFKVKLNKEKIIETVQSYCQTPPYEELSKMYDDLFYYLIECSTPLGMYKIDKKPNNLDLNSLKKCNNIVYCLVTIGDESCKKVESLFEEGKFFEAILLDTMASSYLFHVSSDLFNKICVDSHKLGLGLTSKIAPGDGEIDLEYQKEIVEMFKNDDLHNISIINDCMLYPAKSMSYVYGADTRIAYNEKDHCCEYCHNTSCKMRNLNSKVAKPLLQNAEDCA